MQLVGYSIRCCDTDDVCVWEGARSPESAARCAALMADGWIRSVISFPVSRVVVFFRFFLSCIWLSLCRCFLYFFFYFHIKIVKSFLAVLYGCQKLMFRVSPVLIKKEISSTRKKKTAPGITETEAGKCTIEQRNATLILTASVCGMGVAL